MFEAWAATCNRPFMITIVLGSYSDDLFHNHFK